MAAIEVCSEKEIPLGKKKVVHVNGQKVLIYHLKSGFFATQAHCTHAFWPLKGGKIVEGDKVQCPFHHALFDIKTGKVVHWANFPPGIQVLNVVRGEKKLKVYKVSSRKGKIYLQLSS